MNHQTKIRHLEGIRQRRNNECKKVTTVFKYNLMLLVSKAETHEWQVWILQVRHRVKNSTRNAMQKNFINITTLKRDAEFCCASTEILTSFYCTCIISWTPLSYHCWYSKYKLFTAMEFPATVDFFALQNQIRSGAFEHILPLTFKQILMIWLQADTGYHRSKLETTPMRYLKGHW